MSITDIIIDRNQTSFSGNVPTPTPASDLDTIITTNKGPLRDNPQSGSILKVLLDNGFRDKIETAYRQGHTFTILHVPPQPDFTLIESWNEPVTNEQGITTNQPRKTYQFFKMVTPSTDVLPTPPVTATPSIPVIPEQVVAKKKEVILPSQEITERPLELENHIETTTVTPSSTEPIKNTEPVLEKVVPVVTTPITTAPIKDTPLSSYELLKRKFQNSETSQPSLSENIPAPQKETSSENKKQVFLASVFGNSLNEWEQAKNIPARPFIYPTEYTWGHDEQGNPRSHSLDEYPTHARYLRQKIATSLEELALRGIDIETLPLDRALDALLTHQLIHDEIYS